MSHPIVRFAAGGQLIYVLPNQPTLNQPAVIEVHSVEVTSLAQHEIV